MASGSIFAIRRNGAAPIKDLYAETLEMIAYGESIGYDDVWLSEHHFVEDGYSPAQMPIAAAIAVKTKKIRIGTSVVLLPMYDPVRLAEDGATVDILSDGRFELGAGLGYRAGEFEGLGLKYKERAGRMNEALEIIRRLWEGETLTFHGKHFHIEGARVSPEPVQKPRPPIWVGGFAPGATNARHAMATAISRSTKCGPRTIITRPSCARWARIPPRPT